MALKLGMTVDLDLCMAYMLILGSVNLSLTQGHSGSAEENNIYGMAFKLAMTVDLDLCMAYMLILGSVNLSLTQGHSGSSEENNTYGMPFKLAHDGRLVH